jgi:hypothetical protein
MTTSELSIPDSGGVKIGKLDWDDSGDIDPK